MTLEEFARIVPALSTLPHVDRIKHFAWFLHMHEGKDRFGTSEIKRCYDSLDYSIPNLSQLIRQLAEKKPPDLLRDRRGLRLEGRIKADLDAKYAQRPATIAIDDALAGLTGMISNEAERLFLSEALSCLRHKAYRATIVMTWNLSYNHLLDWILSNELAAFNATIPKRYPKKVGLTIAKKEDFEDLKESEVIEICGTASLFSSNIKKILSEKLNRRNIAAHPSLLEITQYQAEDVVSDLVNNVILKLAL